MLAIGYHLHHCIGIRYPCPVVFHRKSSTYRVGRLVVGYGSFLCVRCSPDYQIWCRRLNARTVFEEPPA